MAAVHFITGQDIASNLGKAARGIKGGGGGTNLAKSSMIVITGLS